MVKRKTLKPPKDLAGYNPVATAGDCVWDAKAAQLALDFFPTFCVHIKGKLAGKPYELNPWEQGFATTLFGWKRADGTRRYREAFVGIPRKNDKTTFCASLSLFAMFCDQEEGAEIYCAAADRDQATLVFDPASKMVAKNPKLAQMAKVLDAQKRIVFPARNSFVRAIPADAAGSHGYNAHCIIIDEMHTQPSRDLYDVLKTSTVARLQPLLVSITTAGYDRNSICWELWEYARQVRDGVIEDPYFLPLIYELGEDEDWEDRENWKRVNPNYGRSVSPEYLEEAYRRAKEVPAYENTFRNLHLNQWVQQSVRWLPMDKWDACDGALPDLDGADCWGGLDLASTQDITAMSLVFHVDGLVYVKPYFWIPEETADLRARRDRVPYSQWAREGLIRTTPGNTADYDFIRRDINEIGKQYRIRTLAYDRWNARQLATQLDDDGLPMLEWGQGYASMSSPAKELERLVVDRKLRHGGHKVLRWMAGNVARKEDAAGNIKPDKEKSGDKIDGIVATVMALGAMADVPISQFVYRDRGILTL